MFKLGFPSKKNLDYNGCKMQLCLSSACKIQLHDEIMFNCYPNKMIIIKLLFWKVKQIFASQKLFLFSKLSLYFTVPPSESSSVQAFMCDDRLIAQLLHLFSLLLAHPILLTVTKDTHFVVKHSVLTLCFVSDGKLGREH